MENNNVRQVKMLNPLVLAYIGDGVLELMVRERLVVKGIPSVHKLHQMTVSYVCAAAQSRSVALIEGMLTEEETIIYKRGRNASGNHVPKNTNPLEYHRATGFEALFGFLHLTQQRERIEELFSYVCQAEPGSDSHPNISETL